MGITLRWHSATLNQENLLQKGPSPSVLRGKQCIALYFAIHRDGNGREVRRQCSGNVRLTVKAAVIRLRSAMIFAPPELDFHAPGT